MAAGTMTKPAGKAQAPAKAPPPQVFRVGVYETDTPDIDVTLAATAAAQKLGTFKISPNGWLSQIRCLFELTTSGGAGNTFTGDQPFSGIQKVTFRDVGNREIFGPLTGYEWFTVCKWGGYYPGNPDPRSPSAGYQATATTGGLVTFQLYVPLEIYIDSIANTAGGATGVSWRMRANLEGYTEPEMADSHGRPFSQSPPAAGTVQYWASEIWVAPSGAGIKYNQQNGIGYAIRNLVWIGYDNAAGLRANAWNFTLVTAGETGGFWPDPFTLAFGKVQLFQRPVKMWQDFMSRWFGLEGAATPDAAYAMENGVFVQAFNREFAGVAGQELRNGYLITKAGNVLQGSGTYTGAVNSHVLTNYIVPPGNDASRLRAR